MMYNLMVLSFLIILPLSAMLKPSDISQELKTRKLYAADFKALGIEFTSLLHTFLDRSKIIPNQPLNNIPLRWQILVEVQRAMLKKQIAECYQVPLYLKYIDDRIGFGVFADASIKEFDTICEYTGQLCVEEDDESKDMDLNFSMDVGPYNNVDGKNKQLYVDAKKAGNFSRFINHSYLHNVNSISVYSEQDGLWHVMLHANQDIAQDDQLLANYGEGYWKSRGIEPIDLTANS